MIITKVRIQSLANLLQFLISFFLCTIEILKFIQHPQYIRYDDIEKQKESHDIGLVELESPFKVGSKVKFFSSLNV